MEFERNSERPVAVIDSGMGGISVLRELVKVLPEENFIFFGDSLHAPYGTKDIKEVRALTMEHAGRLFARGAKGLVVACNTATSAAVRALRERYPDAPVVGIEPAVKPAVESGEHPTVLIMATPMTIREEKLRALMDRYRESAELLPLSCPGLMDFVERGDLDGEDLKSYLRELLFPYRERRIDACVLGCTHYPFVRKQIGDVLGAGTKIFDGGEGTARELRRRLEAARLRNSSGAGGTILFENSDPSPEKLALMKRLFELPEA